MVTLMLLSISSHPSLATIYLSLFSVFLVLFLKNKCFSLMMYLILIIFSTGILLLLFYLTMINDKTPCWNNKLSGVVLLTSLILPSSIVYNFTWGTSNLMLFIEFTEMKILLFSYFMMALLLMILWVLNEVLSETKFVRQII